MSDNLPTIARKVLGVFSSEQHERLLRICLIASNEDHEQLLDALVEIRHYQEIGPVLNEFPPLMSHRQNLSDVAEYASKLLNLIRQEPLLDRMLFAGLANTYTSEKSSALSEIIFESLSVISAEAKLMSENIDLLRSVRLGKDESGKSLERRLIWEPFLSYWSKTGKKIGFSENGPIISALRVIHEAFGIEPPIADTIRQVIRDHQRGGVLRVVK